jgi:hypothetical protein
MKLFPICFVVCKFSGKNNTWWTTYEFGINNREREKERKRERENQRIRERERQSECVFDGELASE